MNRRLLYPLFTLLLLLSANITKAQQIGSLTIDSLLFNEQMLQMKVKQIDEFFARFNFRENLAGERVTPDQLTLQQKQRQLLSLLHPVVFATPDHQPDSLALLFLDLVISAGKQIHYVDQNWQAHVQTSLTYGGKSYPATLMLQTERVEGVSYRWAVAGVESSLFDSYPLQPSDSIMISPADHGIGFLELPTMFELNAAAAGTAFVRDYQRSPLAVLDFLIATGKAKLGALKGVSYHFELGELTFTVERIEDPSSIYGPGWVITNLSIDNL